MSYLRDRERDLHGVKIKNSGVEDMRYLRDRERDLHARADRVDMRPFPFYRYGVLKKDGFLTTMRVKEGSVFFILSFLGHAVLAAYEENADRQTI